MPMGATGTFRNWLDGAPVVEQGGSIVEEPEGGSSAGSGAADGAPLPSNIPVPLIHRSMRTLARATSVKMESKRIRRRRTHSAILDILEVRWHLTADQFQWFKDFFEDTLQNGTLPFTMTTFDPSPKPGIVVEIDWKLAFLNATYTLVRSDNLFAVDADLEVFHEIRQDIADPISSTTLEVEYEDSTCKDVVKLKWKLVPDLLNILETAGSADGPWHDYIYAAPTPTQKASGVMDVRLNNDYDGKRHFRVSINGSPITDSVQPDASTVPPPDVTVSNVSPSTKPMQSLGGGFVRPYSWKENDKIQPLDLYVEPRIRFQDVSDFDGQGRIVEVTNVDPSAVHTWTQDGSDPKEDDGLPKVDGVLANAGSYRFDFKGLIKARSWKGGCKSPVCFVLIDRTYDMLPLKRTNGNSKVASGYCDLVKNETISIGGEQIEHTYESGFSCGDVPNVQCIARDKVDSGTSSGAAVWQDDTISFLAITDSNKPTWMGWTGQFASINRRSFTSLEFLSGPPFQSMPELFSNIDWKTKWTPTGVDDPGEEEGYSEGGGLLGSGGSYATMDALATQIANAFVGKGQLSDDCGIVSQSVFWEKLLFLITAHYDFPDPVTTVPSVGEYPGDPEPEPEPPAGVKGDTFESYAQGDAELLVLGDGSGWNAAWVVEDLPGNGQDGDHFEDYADVDEIQSKDGGNNMEDFWAIQEPIHEEGGDDLESYAEGEVALADVLETFNGGSGWDAGWDFGLGFQGADDFEQYATGAVTQLQDADFWPNGYLGDWITEDI